MTYNFDKVIERRDTNCVKWDASKVPFTPTYCESRDIIPMWVADMDFETPPFVIEAIKKRLDHSILGYSFIPDEYYEAIDQWHQQRYQQQGANEETIMYQNSVLGGVASTVVAFTQPGDNVLIQSSTYSGFQHTVSNLGRNLVYSNLQLDQKGIYRMNLEEMEHIIQTKSVTLFIFCSPHNPTGRVWEKQEIESMISLCKKYNVIIVSDEIWADFMIEQGHTHIPTASCNQDAKDITIGFYAPSKTFNLAGLVGAYSLCYNSYLQKRLQKVATDTHYNSANVLSVAACIGAYQSGAQWVDEMNVYIRRNQEYLVDFLNTRKGFRAYLPQATYLLWVDVSQCDESTAEIYQKLKSVGIIVNNGQDFKGDGFLRFNCACTFANLKEACDRMSTIFVKK